MKYTAAAALAVSLFATASVFAAPPTKPAPAPKASPTVKKAEAKLYCAVTGEEIGSMGAAGGSSIYKGKKYLFCCGGCKPQFDKNPEKYVKTAKTALPVPPAAPAAKPAPKKA